MDLKTDVDAAPVDAGVEPLPNDATAEIGIRITLNGTTTMHRLSLLLVLFVAFGCNMPAATHNHGLGAARSSQWPKVRAAYLKIHPTCEACDQPAEEIHHLTPFARDPSKELDPENLIALCHHDHLLIGHADNYRTYNPDAKQDAAKLLKMIRDIKAKRLENKP